MENKTEPNPAAMQVAKNQLIGRLTAHPTPVSLKFFVIQTLFSKWHPVDSDEPLKLLDLNVGSLRILAEAFDNVGAKHAIKGRISENEARDLLVSKNLIARADYQISEYHRYLEEREKEANKIAEDTGLKSRDKPAAAAPQAKESATLECMQQQKELIDVLTHKLREARASLRMFLMVVLLLSLAAIFIGSASVFADRADRQAKQSQCDIIDVTAEGKNLWYCPDGKTHLLGDKL